MMHSLAVCLMTLLFSAQDVSTKEDSTPSPPPATAQDDLSQVDIDALIRRLPPAGEEWHWDDAKNDGIENAAALEMARRLNAGIKLTDEQWRLALLSTGAIRYHHKWPRDESFAVSLTVPRWLGLTQIRLDPQPEGLESTKVGELLSGMCGTYAAIDRRDARQGRGLGLLPNDAADLSFDVEVERGRSWMEDEGDSSSRMLWKGAITVPVEQVDTMGQITEPVDNESVVEAVRDAIGAGVRTWGGNDEQVRFVVIDPDTTKFPLLETIGLDIKVELLDGERVIAESWLVANDIDTLTLQGSIHTGRKRFYSSANLNVPNDSGSDANWVLRLSGRNDHVWMLWHATKHWSGTITIPWAQAVEHEVKRTADRPRGPEVSVPRWR